MRFGNILAHRQDGYRGFAIPATLATSLIVVALAARAASAEPGARDGAAVFAARCARCHGESGRADTPSARALKVRPLVDDATLAVMAPAEIAKMVRSDAKHNGVGALRGVDDADLEAAAAFVRGLAKKR